MGSTSDRQYYQTVAMLVKEKVNLNNLLDQTMPGIQNLISYSEKNHKLTDFVASYWHFEHILHMGEKSSFRITVSVQKNRDTVSANIWQKKSLH